LLPVCVYWSISTSLFYSLTFVNASDVLLYLIE
jgi:hypothetical protein